MVLYSYKELGYALIISIFITSTNANISFIKYCQNETNPGIIPSTGKSSAGFLSLSDKKMYDAGMNCSVTLSVENGYHLLVSFIDVNLRNSTLDSLTVIYNNHRQHSLLAGQKKCINESCPGLMFQSGMNGHNITFLFMSSNLTVPLDYTGFNALYTVFDTAVDKTGQCSSSDRFLCVNSHCIAKELVCDHHNNCGDRSDEAQCEVSIYNTTWGIVVITIAVVSLVIFVPLFCYLALSGTRTAVKSVTLPNQPTPLYSAVNNDEGSNLLSSSFGSPSTSTFYNVSHRSRSFSIPVHYSGDPHASSSSSLPSSYQGMSHIPS